MDGLGSVGEISDAVNGALDKGVDQDTDIADQVMPVRSQTSDPKHEIKLLMSLQERRDMGEEEASPHQRKQQQQQQNNPLKALASESGLGSLFGHSHHGLGLLPVCFVHASR